MPVIEALTGGGKALIPKTATMTPYIKAIVFYIKAIDTRKATINSYIKTIDKSSKAT